MPIPFFIGVEGDNNVALNVAYKLTEHQQIILRIIKNEDTDNVALNGKPSVNPVL